MLNLTFPDLSWNAVKLAGSRKVHRSDIMCFSPQWWVTDWTRDGCFYVPIGLLGSKSELSTHGDISQQMYYTFQYYQLEAFHPSLSLTVLTFKDVSFPFSSKLDTPKCSSSGHIQQPALFLSITNLNALKWQTTCLPSGKLNPRFGSQSAFKGHLYPCPLPTAVYTAGSSP